MDNLPTWFLWIAGVAVGSLSVREDGTVEISAEDAEPFIRDGWTKLAEWDATGHP